MPFINEVHPNGMVRKVKISEEELRSMKENAARDFDFEKMELKGILQAREQANERLRAKAKEDGGRNAAAPSPAPADGPASRPPTSDLRAPSRIGLPDQVCSRRRSIVAILLADQNMEQWNASRFSRAQKMNRIFSC